MRLSFTSMALALVAILVFRLHCQARISTPQMVPDPYTRAKAQCLAVGGIEYVSLEGPEVGEPTVIVTDQKLIAQFLDALRHAYGYGGSVVPGNRVDTIGFHFKPYHNRIVAPVEFSFAIRDAIDCFGPQFQRLVNGPLAKYRAERFTQWVREKEKDIDRIDIWPATITDPAEIARLLKAFELLDERAFYCLPFGDVLPFRLHLRSAGERDFLFHYASLSAFLPELQKYVTNTVASPAPTHNRPARP